MPSSTDAPPASLMSRTGHFLDRWVTPRIVRPLATVTAVTMFIVYALGTLVTTTRSGHGCGDSWPLCRGRFIPEFAIATAIEFTHRVATAAVTVLVLATAFGVLWLWRSRLELRILAPLMVLALFAEAGLGAALVLLSASPVLLAIHFGSSLILFGSVLLTALIVNTLDGWDRLRDQASATGFRVLAFALAVYTYVVGYLGAYMRLRGAEISCQGWPTCNGEVFPGFSGFVGIAFTHRVAAFVLLVGTTWLFIWARSTRSERPDLYRGSFWALLAVAAQVLAGALVALTHVARYSQLIHAGLVALLFGSLIYVCLQTLPRPTGARAPAEKAPPPSAQPATSGAQ
ncbi:MAG TPA: COX15/CtaA family protein [Ktedonobacterales bacterium]|nr:COX15/CtaA family protein [Ktedonobacterales bacterium]